MTRTTQADAMESSEHHAKYAQVEAVLRRRIQNGALEPGRRLVRQALARELGVSPIPVIEALHRLEHDGLVEHVPNIGARVVAATPERSAGDRVLRCAIEGEIGRTLARRLGPALLDELREDARALDALMQAGDTPSERGAEAHRAFHMKLARLTGHEVLESELSRLWSRRYMQKSWDNARSANPVPPDWHEMLIVALSTGEPMTAYEAFHRHGYGLRPGDKETSDAL